MGLKRKQRKLDWWIANFGEDKGRKLYLDYLEHKRRRTIEIAKAVSGVGLLLRVFGK